MQLSDQQISTLSDLWTDYASAMSAYQSDHSGDDDVDNEQLTTWITDAAALGDNYSNAVLVASFNDTASAYSSLKNVIHQADIYVASLKGTLQSWNRFARVAHAMITLSQALTGGASGILSAASGVAQAYTGNANAKTTDPAPDGS